MLVYYRKDNHEYVDKDGIHSGITEEDELGSNNPYKTAKLALILAETGLDEDDLIIVYASGDEMDGDARRIMKGHLSEPLIDSDPNSSSFGEVIGISFAKEDALETLKVDLVEHPDGRIKMTYPGDVPTPESATLRFRVYNPNGTFNNLYNEVIKTHLYKTDGTKSVPIEVNLVNGEATMPFKPSGVGEYAVFLGGQYRLPLVPIKIDGPFNIEVYSEDEVVI